MKAIHQFLKDRRRSQRGSVLSAVLIITAFIAIIAGALMTELSTNFLLSRSLVNRVNNQATVNSAMELAVDQFQKSSIWSGCPQNLPQASVNNLIAVTSYASCGPTVDLHSTPAYVPITPRTGFQVDGTYVQSTNEYLLGDSTGKVYRFGFGQTIANWTVGLGGSVSGPPMLMPNGSTMLVPVTNPTASGNPGCGQPGTCVAVSTYPDTGPDCYMVANGTVASRPAASTLISGVAYFGDSSGSVSMYNDGNCGLLMQQSAATQAVVAGPLVFTGVGPKRAPADDVFVVTSDQTGSQLVELEFTWGKHGLPTFSVMYSVPLAAPNAVGMAVDQGTLPARIAITFAGGMVQLAQLQSGLAPVAGISAQLPTAIAGAPAWCCGNPPTRIGVGGLNRSFYVLDSALTTVSTYGLAGAIHGTPNPDQVGDWFVGADDGNLYEIPAIQTRATTLSFGAGALGLIRSSVQVGPCGRSLCAYFASSNGSAYAVQLDARDIVLSACTTPSPSNCVWAHLQVGSLNNAQTVHVQGWSYYSG